MNRSRHDVTQARSSVFTISRAIPGFTIGLSYAEHQGGGRFVDGVAEYLRIHNETSVDRGQIAIYPIEWRRVRACPVYTRCTRGRRDSIVAMCSLFQYHRISWTTPPAPTWRYERAAM